MQPRPTYTPPHTSVASAPSDATDLTTPATLTQIASLVGALPRGTHTVTVNLGQSAEAVAMLKAAGAEMSGGAVVPSVHAELRVGRVRFTAFRVLP